MRNELSVAGMSYARQQRVNPFGAAPSGTLRPAAPSARLWRGGVLGRAALSPPRLPPSTQPTGLAASRSRGQGSRLESGARVSRRGGSLQRYAVTQFDAVCPSDFSSAAIAMLLGRVTEKRQRAEDALSRHGADRAAALLGGGDVAVGAAETCIEAASLDLEQLAWMENALKTLLDHAWKVEKRKAFKAYHAALVDAVRQSNDFWETDYPGMLLMGPAVSSTGNPPGRTQPALSGENAPKAAEYSGPVVTIGTGGNAITVEVGTAAIASNAGNRASPCGRRLPRRSGCARLRASAIWPPRPLQRRTLTARQSRPPGIPAATAVQCIPARPHCTDIPARARPSFGHLAEPAGRLATVFRFPAARQQPSLTLDSDLPPEMIVGLCVAVTMVNDRVGRREMKR